MKKLVVILFIIAFGYVITNHETKIIIPKESIRFRIIANSNSREDQNLKWQINRELIPILNDITENSNSLDESRNVINENINEIKHITNKYTNDYKVKFGQNYFPMKKYNNVIYDEGNYESLVITLGEGLGDNWWCVLFPPLCLMEAKSADLDSIKYESYLKSIINKYF